MMRRRQNYLLVDIVALAGMAAMIGFMLHRPAFPTADAPDGGATARLHCTERARTTLAQIRLRKQPVEIGAMEGSLAPRNTRWVVTIGAGRTPDRLDCEIRDEHKCLLRRVPVRIGSRPSETVVGLTLCSAQNFVKNPGLFRLESVGPGIELALTLSNRVIVAKH